MGPLCVRSTMPHFLSSKYLFDTFPIFFHLSPSSESHRHHLQPSPPVASRPPVPPAAPRGAARILLKVASPPPRHLHPRCISRRPNRRSVHLADSLAEECSQTDERPSLLVLVMLSFFFPRLPAFHVFVCSCV